MVSACLLPTLLHSATQPQPRHKGQSCWARLAKALPTIQGSLTEVRQVITRDDHQLA